MGSRMHGVDCDLDITGRAVLKANRHRETGCEVAMDLALGRARPNCTPGDQIGDELRCNRIKELNPCRQTHADDVNQQAAGDGQALINREAAIQVWIVDQSLPTNGRSWLL